MVIDIFSSQDSYIFYFTRYIRRAIWLQVLLIFLFLSYIFWLNISRYSLFIIKLLNFVYRIFFDNLGKENSIIKWGITLIYFSLFFFIFFLNYRGLVSYIFRYTVQILIVVPIGFRLWIRIIIFLNYKRYKNFICHLIPYGIPLWLSPFILIIETISNLVRPITLRVRLIANIGAGHIIIHLISIGCVFSRSLYYFFSLSFIISLYILFEVLISLIQSLIFFTLLILYLRE